MIRLSEEILINEDIQKVWAFLSNLKFSLSFNRFHVEIKFFGQFSVNNNSEFIIVHNFGFGNLDMIAKVIECIPLKRLAISEQPIKPNKKWFSHKIVFELQKNGDFTNLCYSLSGTYGGKVQNISFKPILKRVLKEEIKKIKIAIESSDSVPENLNIGNISP